MNDIAPTTTLEADTLDATATPDESTALVAEDLIEEVSIDGMCGVY